MAAVQNLEVLVEVNIKQAIAALTELQDELREVATQIEEVDAIGSDGIDIRTDVDELDTELATLAAEIEAFEHTTGINIPVRLDQNQFGALRGLLRDALGDAIDGADFGDIGGVRAATAAAGGGGGGRGFGSPFLALGTRGRARMDRIGTGMGMLFGRNEGTRARLMRNLSSTLSSAFENFKEFDIRMSDLHNLLAALIPLLVVFIGALPAAITALLTLAGAALAAAAAFAVIGGLGALGAAMGPGGGMPSAEDFTEFWEDIRDGFFEAFAPLAERLAPVFMDALDGLERFFEAVAGEGDALMSLVDDARGFGGFLIDFIPRMLRGLAALVESMSSTFGDLGRFLNEEIISIIRGFAKATIESLPALTQLAGVLMDALPGLIQVSIGFARVSTAAIVLFQAIAFLITGFNQLGGETLGIVIASTLTLITVTALASKTMAFFSGGVLAGVIQRLYSYVAVLVNATLAKLGFVAATNLAARAIAVLITTATLLIGIGLLAWTVSETAKMTGLANSIRDATGAMSEFNRVSGRGGSGNFNPYRGPGGSGGGSSPGGGGGVTINMERSGDRETDKSDLNKASWRMGRTSGGGA